MQRTKFILGGVLILAAVVYLIVSSTQASAEYFMTVDEVKAKARQPLARVCVSPVQCSATRSNMMPTPLPSPLM